MSGSLVASIIIIFVVLWITLWVTKQAYSVKYKIDAPQEDLDSSVKNDSNPLNGSSKA